MANEMIQNTSTWLTQERRTIVECAALCQLCQKYMIDAVPLQAKCGHAFCKSCIDVHLEEHSHCPNSACDRSISASDLTPATVVERVIRSWVLPFVTCYYCGLQTQDPDSHLAQHDCPRKCAEGMRLCKKRHYKEVEDYEQHSRQCGAMGFICECCSKRVQRRDMNSHLASCWQSRVVKRRFMWFTGSDVTVISSHGVQWTLTCKSAADTLPMQLALSLQSAVQQTGFQHVNLAAHISKLRVELYHPLTGALIVSKDKPEPFYCYAEYSSDHKDWFNLCSVNDLKALGAVDAARDLCEWDIQVSFVVDRLWDCHQRDMGKRQKPEQKAESDPDVAAVVGGPVAIEGKEEQQQQVKAVDAAAPLPGAPAVEVIVAQ